ncbi:MAG TPA: phosphoglycerate dehydrogenase [Phycisphaerales bacterium]|nr:phosphoglycerate dehydrogenase [Phycisphaerales bacterium]
MAIRILIADSLAPEGAEYLKSQSGVEVTVNTKWAGNALAEALASHDGAVVRSAVQITGAVLNEAFKHKDCRLQGIARAGVGVDNIDLETATKFGVAVMNSASASTITTAEHAFAMMMALARNIGPAYMTMRNGGWDRNKFVGTQLHGKTLGVVGMGRIGQAMARRARAFGMNVIGYDPMVDGKTALDGTVRLTSTFEELLEHADIVSFHVPKTDKTSGMLGAEQFAKAKKGLLVVNAARGGIVDEAALLAALDAGQCGGAAIDVFEPEPLAAESPLRTHAKVLVTPHLGASTVEAQEAVAFDACRSLLKFLKGEGLEGAVNAEGLNLDLTDRQKMFVELSLRMAQMLNAVADLGEMREIKVFTRGTGMANRGETICRYALAEVLGLNSSTPVTVINAMHVARERKINVEARSLGEQGDDRLTIEVVNGKGESHVVEGTVYGDGQLRITNLDGYMMDMVASGHMVILTNADRPGRIGLVGQLFGNAGVNIAEMVIGRRPRGENGEVVAMMVMKVDGSATEGLIKSLRGAEGIMRAVSVDLPITAG